MPDNLANTIQVCTLHQQPALHLPYRRLPPPDIIYMALDGSTALDTAVIVAHYFPTHLLHLILPWAVWEGGSGSCTYAPGPMPCRCWRPPSLSTASWPTAAALHLKPSSS